MKYFYRIAALISVILGFICLFKHDVETFKYATLMGMLFDIEAKLEEKDD